MKIQNFPSPGGSHVKIPDFSRTRGNHVFKAPVMSQLDYGCQLWSPHLIKHRNMVEKVLRSFTRFISGMEGLSYPERLIVLKLYYLQHRKDKHYYLYVEDFGRSCP